jgi:transketolase
MRSIHDLEVIAEGCRDKAIIMAEACGSGHLGGSFSIMDVLVALEFKIMKSDDILIYSKAHCCEALYAVLYYKDRLQGTDSMTFGEWGSKLQCHSEHWAFSEVDYTGGSLGQGLSYACGVALGKKLKKETGRAFCIVGDGECHEGQLWEAAMFAKQYKLDNLFLIVDYNEHTGDCNHISEVVDLDPLAAKFRFFGWDAMNHFDGNDMERIVNVLDCYSDMKIPTAYVMFTTKGKGVKVWEKSHSHLQFGDELKEGIKEWRSHGT